MDSLFGFILAIVVFFLFGFFAGWDIAHVTIATECRRQGSFYVNKSDFTCAITNGAQQ